MDETNTLEIATTAPVEQVESIEQAAPLSNKEQNLVALRKRLEAEEDARKAAERRAADMEQRIQQMSQPPPPAAVVEEDDLSVDNEEYVQAKHVKSSNKKIKTKLHSAEQKLQELEQKLAYMEAKVDTDSLKDFNKVVSDENLKMLATLYPDDYQTMMANPNLKAKSKTAYNMIKNYGIIESIPDNAIPNRLIANAQKPRAASTASPQAAATPLARLNDYDRRVLTEADRDRILAEVERKKMSY